MHLSRWGLPDVLIQRDSERDFMPCGELQTRRAVPVECIKMLMAWLELSLSKDGCTAEASR
jgi:hypothetical protein